MTLCLDDGYIKILEREKWIRGRGGSIIPSPNSLLYEKEAPYQPR